ncbi:glutathione S-transferase family protein [Pararoseomonas indoligenes]|uniref:Glutathione S-transferase family protein n=1 Tax=Roseomonas indoligenes TaxID=2820811 RepID=A0A940S9Z1_9PROT|nr:glutathione S-transferase family protein [Pararoseomonas indoligenes]MBP0495657.1 glutathione S-transferase family protein [Pararoseomonas indoligenes]
MSLTLYGCLRSRATRPVWAAMELGLDHRRVPVIQAYRLQDPAAPGAPLNTASPAFRAINPNGLIPALEDDGFVLNESQAITLYLARKAGSPLGPQDAKEEALTAMWALWGRGIEEDCLSIVQKRDPEAAADRLRAPFAVLDKALAEGKGFLVGNRFTVADINMAEIIRYAQPDRTLFEAAPHVQAWITACQARPAFQAMMKEREAEPL